MDLEYYGENTAGAGASSRRVVHSPSSWHQPRPAPPGGNQAHRGMPFFGVCGLTVGLPGRGQPTPGSSERPVLSVPENRRPDPENRRAVVTGPPQAPGTSSPPSGARRSRPARSRSQRFWSAATRALRLLISSAMMSAERVSWSSRIREHTLAFVSNREAESAAAAEATEAAEVTAVAAVVEGGAIIADGVGVNRHLQDSDTEQPKHAGIGIAIDRLNRRGACGRERGPICCRGSGLGCQVPLSPPRRSQPPCYQTCDTGA